jgi:hypothetical protein
MADLTDAQKKRQDARRKRRGGSEEPQQNDSSEAQNGEPLEAVKQAAKVAAAGAAVGAAAAAARAFTHHGNGAEDGRDTEDEQTEPDEPVEPEAESEQADEPQAEQPEEQQPEAQQQDDEREDDQQGTEQQEEPEPEPVEGASLGEAGKAMRTARDQLQELLGKAVESASALERTQNGWVATLEVVELSRIPETTDVLASYELELDEKLGLRSYRQVRRYTRSQANGDGL